MESGRATSQGGGRQALDLARLSLAISSTLTSSPNHQQNFLDFTTSSSCILPWFFIIPFYSLSDTVFSILTLLTLSSSSSQPLNSCVIKSIQPPILLLPPGLWTTSTCPNLATRERPPTLTRSGWRWRTTTSSSPATLKPIRSPPIRWDLALGCSEANGRILQAVELERGGSDCYQLGYPFNLFRSQEMDMLIFVYINHHHLSI